MFTLLHYCGRRPPPARDVNPTVVLMPTKLLLLVGQVMLPSVSVPRVTAAKPMDAAMPEPEDEPHGSAFGKYAFVACPPLPDQPDAMFPLKCAHSDKLAFPTRRLASTHQKEVFKANQE